MVPLITAILPSVILSKVKLQLNLLFVFLFLDVYYTYLLTTNKFKRNLSFQL